MHFTPSHFFRKLRIYIALGLLHGIGRSGGLCANRRWSTFRYGPYRYRLESRDVREPDGYSREELLEMLWLVRKHSDMQEWTPPEPNACELERQKTHPIDLD